ncbi:MAG: phosphatase PAP2 family protein [Gemmatimonadaceae bacterium]
MRAIWPGALLVVYLGATGALLLVGWARISVADVALHFGVLGAIAAATWISRLPRWIRDWAPLLALLFLYTEMPALIRAAGHEQMFDATALRWETAAFAGQPALDWAARWPSVVVSEALHLAYLSYYLIIFSVPAMLYFTGRRQEFSEAVLVLMLTFVACFVAYLVFPVEGPRYSWASSSRAPEGPVRAFVVWLLEARSSRGTAFPSSHVAVSVAQSLLAWRYLGAQGLPIAVLSAGLALGAVYGGFHYGVDVIAGAVLGTAIAVSWIAVTHTRSRDVPIHANATAPT